MKTKTLYRPVGLKELELIADLDWEAFPPRLEWQPIFYPVLNQAYAVQIAKEWNTNDSFSGYCGAVTKFELSEEHFVKYRIENVGADIHNELWIPAEHMNVFNENIVGKIEVSDVYFGDAFIVSQNEDVNKQILKFRK